MGFRPLLLGKNLYDHDIPLFYGSPTLKASLIAQLVKNPPAMQETWVRSLGWEDPPEKGRVTQCSSLDSMDCIIHGIAKSWTQLSLSLSFNPGRTDCLTSPPFYLSGCFFLYVFSCGESFLLVFNLFS